MEQLTPEGLSAVQQVILASAGEYPGQFTRSELAKVLVGSPSGRISAFTGLPQFGRLSDHGRKEITFEIDILLQQGFLALDSHNRLIPAPARSSRASQD